MANIFAAESVDRMTARLLESWARADEACRKQGTSWYGDARKFAADLAVASGLTFNRAAALVAVWSPRSVWSTNKVNATATLVGAGLIDAQTALDILKRSGTEPNDTATRTAHERVSKPHGLNRSYVKAMALARGEDINATVTGQKVRSFWLNIAHPDTTDAVTIDSWAAGAVIGRRLSNAEMSGLTTKQYARVSEAYRRAAAMVKIRPHVMQAIVWCETRNQTGWGRAQHQ